MSSSQPVENLTEPPWSAMILATETMRMPVKITNEAAALDEPTCRCGQHPPVLLGG
jgi:hypothetical protein